MLHPLFGAKDVCYIEKGGQIKSFSYWPGELVLVTTYNTRRRHGPCTQTEAAHGPSQFSQQRAQRQSFKSPQMNSVPRVMTHSPHFPRVIRTGGLEERGECVRVPWERPPTAPCPPNLALERCASEPSTRRVSSAQGIRRSAAPCQRTPLDAFLCFSASNPRLLLEILKGC